MILTHNMYKFSKTEVFHKEYLVKIQLYTT